MNNFSNGSWSAIVTLFAKTMLGLLVVLMASTSIARAEQTARIEEQGTLSIAGGATTATYVVMIGTPRFAPERVALASIFGVYLANARFYIRVPKKGWIVEERRLPVVEDLGESFPNNLIARTPVTESEMPSWFKDLPDGSKENIEGFIAFYSGAFRIYLADRSQESAERLARAINASPN